MNKAEQYMQQSLAARREAGNYRELKPGGTLIDFCSNDYLGFAQSPLLKQYTDAEITSHQSAKNGSAGSRLLAGNTDYAEDLERQIALYHGFEAALLYNSGYDANVGLFSSLPQRGDTVIADELAHASIIDGIRLSHANRYTFKHNDLQSLEEKLRNASGRIYVAVESIYSMDGDVAPLEALAALTQCYEAMLIVDEAHATGIFGKGMVEQLGLQQQVFAKLVTYGKGMGCHGAAVLGGTMLRNYLINFSRSFIYTTAAPFHQLAAIKMAYRLLDESTEVVDRLHTCINIFRETMHGQMTLIDSPGAIQCVITGSNERAKGLAMHLQSHGFDVRPVLSPTVAAGKERVRICLHSFNTSEQVEHLATLINDFKI